MKTLKNIPIIVFALFLTAAAYAGDSNGQLDEETQRALNNTKKLLETSHQRQMYYQDNPNAQVADKNLDKLVGGDAQEKQRVYELTSKVFERMVKGNNGDMNKLKESLIRAQQDPEAFANSLSDEERKLLRDVASGIEKKHGQMPNK